MDHNRSLSGPIDPFYHLHGIAFTLTQKVTSLSVPRCQVLNDDSHSYQRCVRIGTIAHLHSCGDYSNKKRKFIRVHSDTSFLWNLCRKFNPNNNFQNNHRNYFYRSV